MLLFEIQIIVHVFDTQIPNNIETPCDIMQVSTLNASCTQLIHSAYMSSQIL